MTTKKKVQASLIAHGLRHYVQAIDANPATPGEVVVWIGGAGHPVYRVSEALTLARRERGEGEFNYTRGCPSCGRRMLARSGSYPVNYCPNKLCRDAHLEVSG